MKNFRFFLVFSLCPLCLCGESLAGDWPQFRGPGGTAVSDEVGLPVTWSATENVRWKVELPGRGVSSPVVAGGRAYITACTGPKQDRLHVLCFDAASGKKHWERQFWATGNTLCNPKTCMAGPTPVTDGKRVFALFATGDLACLDADGDLLWYRSLVRDYPNITNQVGMAASPILYKDVLLLPMENAGDSFVAGLDADTGKNRWKQERARDINWVTPVLFNDGKQTHVLFQSRQEISAYDPETGKKRWTYKADGLSTIPSPLVGNGLIFTPAGELTALRPVAAKEVPEVVWQTNLLRTGYATPLLYQNRLYAVNSAGVLNCVEAREGQAVWQERLKVKAQFSASPVAGDGKLYLVNEEGTTVVVQLGDQPRVLATNKLGETILATPAIAGGALFLRSDQHLYCIAEKK